MSRLRLRLLTAAVGVFVALFGSVIVASTPAMAASCYGDWCSGQDPQATGCSADAYVVASADVYSGRANLQLRWSPSCQTNWARLYIYPSNNWFPGGTLVARQSSGYQQSLGTVSTQGERTYWTSQIYSPQLCVRAEFHSGWGDVSTACI